MSQLNDAAAAFDADMGLSTREPSKPSGKQEVERWDMGEVEDDEVAGGDGEPDPEEVDPEDENFDDPEDDGNEPDPEDEPKDKNKDEEEDEDVGVDLKHKVSIVVDGEEQEVSLREALDGYIRTETFHKRMNEVNEGVNIVRRAAGEVAAKRDATIAMYDEMEAALKGLIPPEPDWDKEYTRDAKAARELQKQYEGVNAKLAEVKANREKLQTEKQQEDQRNLQAWANEENAKIPKLFPEWSDTKVRDRDMSSMRRTAKAAGYNDAEIDGLIDTRQLVILAKAAKLDRMQARRARPNPNKQGEGKLKPNPGAGSTRTAPRGVAQAQKRLSRTGSVEAAGQLFAGMIQREG